jgi:preprotein translocase subunit SecA
MRIFGGERMQGILEKLPMEEGVPIEHNLISRAIENAQAKVEGHNFDIRKQLLEYDDVMNQQREVIYRQRRQALDGKDLKDTIQEIMFDKSSEIANAFADERALPEEWDFKGVDEAVFKQFNTRMGIPDEDTLDGLTEEGLSQLIYDTVQAVYLEKETLIGESEYRSLERFILLQTVDQLWKDHLLSMDHLKEGIGLRGYAQQNPLIVYKKEGFEMFQDMIERVKEETLSILFRIQPAEPESLTDIQKPQEQQLVFSGGDTSTPKKKPATRSSGKVGRNAPCPCGSGKKYKQCHGK